MSIITLPLSSTVAWRSSSVRLMVCHCPAGFSALTGRGNSTVNPAHVMRIEASVRSGGDLNLVDAAQIDSAVASFRNVHFQLQVEILEFVDRVRRLP